MSEYKFQNGRTRNSRLALQAEAANENNILGFSRETEPTGDVGVQKEIYY